MAKDGKKRKKGAFWYGAGLVFLVLLCAVLLVYGIAEVFVAVQANGFDRTMQPVSVTVGEDGQKVLQVLDFYWTLPWDQQEPSVSSTV